MSTKLTSTLLTPPSSPSTWVSSLPPKTLAPPSRPTPKNALGASLAASSGERAQRFGKHKARSRTRLLTRIHRIFNTTKSPREAILCHLRDYRTVGRAWLYRRTSDLRLTKREVLLVATDRNCWMTSGFVMERRVRHLSYKTRVQR